MTMCLPAFPCVQALRQSLQPHHHPSGVNQIERKTIALRAQKNQHSTPCLTGFNNRNEKPRKQVFRELPKKRRDGGFYAQRFF